MLQTPLSSLKRIHHSAHSGSFTKTVYQTVFLRSALSEEGSYFYLKKGLVKYYSIYMGSSLQLKGGGFYIRKNRRV